MLGPRDDSSDGTSAQQVEPCHAVSAARARERRERRVQGVDPVRIDRDQRAAHGTQPDPRRDDHAGQAHPADRRLEYAIGRPGEQLNELGRGGQQRDRLDVAAERPRHAVVLAMDVACDRAADGDVLRPRHDRNHPPRGHEHVQQVADRRTRVCGDDPMFGVELEPPQLCGIEHESARQLGGVAVTASLPAGDRTAGGELDRGAQRRHAVWTHERHLRAGAPAPTPHDRAARPDRDRPLGLPHR